MLTPSMPVKWMPPFSRERSSGRFPRFVLTTGRRTVFAEGARALVPPGASHGRDLAARVHATLLDARREFRVLNPVVVGALPFDGELPPQLWVPARVRRKMASALAVRNTWEEDDPFDVRAVPDPETYLDAVRRTIERIRRGDVDKVVLARSLELTARASIDVSALFDRLARSNPGAYTFAVTLPSEHAGTRTHFGEAEVPDVPPSRTLIGASPELLVSRSGLRVTANPLAGSAARSPDPSEDRRRAQALLRSGKDRHEHAFVVEGVAEALRPFCQELCVPREPSLLKTSTMWHLSTRVYGRLADPAICALSLATALHPTPAVCGSPTKVAMSTIRELEGFDRAFYTGLVGWRDLAGDGEWILNIRSGEVRGRRMRLFAGAGIVAQSRPETELAETSAKLRTVLLALGIGSTSARPAQPEDDRWMAFSR